jgi:hypothetical protein
MTAAGMQDPQGFAVAVGARCGGVLSSQDGAGSVDRIQRVGLVAAAPGRRRGLGRLEDGLR